MRAHEPCQPQTSPPIPANPFPPTHGAHPKHGARAGAATVPTQGAQLRAALALRARAFLAAHFAGGEGKAGKEEELVPEVRRLRALG